MTEQRNALCRRIRSVKSWLSRAEKNFGNDDDVRGELNLLLAEAELQRLREAEGKKSARRRHVAAAALAAAIAFGFWFARDTLPRPGSQRGAAGLPAKESALKEDIEQKETGKAAIAILKPTLPGIEFSREEKPAPATDAAAPEKSVASFSESELRGFARTAGKALRGNI